MVIKKLNRVGKNSRSILIDKNIIKLLEIKDKVTLEIENGKIILTPFKED
jgi:hypothetical protein